MEIVVELLGRKECFEAPPTLTEDFLSEIYERFDITIGDLFESDKEKVYIKDSLISREYTLELSDKDIALTELKKLGIEFCQESLYNEHENVYVIELLLNAGISMFPEDKYGELELYKNIDKKNLDIIKLLVKSGLDVNYKYYPQTHGGETLFYIFLERLRNCYKIDKNIIKYLAEITDDISLSLFYLNFHVDLIEYFVGKGVNIYTLDCENRNILCDYTDEDCINYILDLDTERKLDIESVFEFKIHISAYEDCEIYINRGIYPDSKECIEDLCPGSSENHDIQYKLMELIFEKNIIELNDWEFKGHKYSPLEIIMEDYSSNDKNHSNYCVVEKAELLLKHGANPNYITSRKESVLEIAQKFEDKELANLLINYGAKQ